MSYNTVKGISDLDTLLASMQPQLNDDEFVFCTFAEDVQDFLLQNAIAFFRETEGITLVLTREQAKSAGLNFNAVFKQITLNVHSSLEAVGLTAAVSTALANEGISANVIAAYYHDHIFVPKELADIALVTLKALSRIN